MIKHDRTEGEQEWTSKVEYQPAAKIMNTMNKKREATRRKNYEPDSGRDHPWIFSRPEICWKHLTSPQHLAANKQTDKSTKDGNSNIPVRRKKQTISEKNQFPDFGCFCGG